MVDVMLSDIYTVGSSLHNNRVDLRPNRDAWE